MSTAPDRRRLATAWIVLAVVLAAALAVGAGRPGGAPSAAARVAAIEAAVRCPSCEDLSVAQSSAPAAVAIRHAVAQRVASGQSDDTIEAYLVSRYGPGILLRPPAHGGAGLVWLVPVAAIAVALGAMGTFLWRRRRTSAPPVDDDDRRLVAEALAEERDR